MLNAARIATQHRLHLILSVYASVILDTLEQMGHALCAPWENIAQPEAQLSRHALLILRLDRLGLLLKQTAVVILDITDLMEEHALSVDQIRIRLLQVR